MSQTAVKELICDVCGAEIRDGSLFCYNCGTSVTERIGQSELQTKASEEKGPVSPSIGISNGKDSDLVRPTPPSGRRPRKRPAQNHDVVWAERDGTSLGFVVTTVVLVLLSTVILIAGFYFR
jgi:hypothetical protein